MSAQILTDAKALEVNAMTEEQIQVLVLSANAVAMASHLLGNGGIADDRIREYTRRSEQYSRRLSPSATATMGSRLFLITVQPKLVNILAMTDAQALLRLREEIQHWETLRRSEGETETVGYGLAQVLLMEAILLVEQDDPTAADKALAVEHLSRAEKLLAFNGGEEWEAPVLPLTFGVWFELARLYDDAGQPEKALKMFQVLWTRVEKAGPIAISMRAATIEKLARHWELKGAPDDTARLMEVTLRETDEALTELRRRKSPVSIIDMPSAATGLVGSKAIPIVYAKLAQRLGEYRLVQAHQANDNVRREQLQRLAGNTFKALLSFIEALPEHSSHDLLSKSEVERLIRECESSTATPP